MFIIGRGRYGRLTYPNAQASPSASRIATGKFEGTQPSPEGPDVSQIIVVGFTPKVVQLITRLSSTTGAQIAKSDQMGPPELAADEAFIQDPFQFAPTPCVELLPNSFRVFSFANLAPDAIAPGFPDVYYWAAYG